jgi:hypothetical protein
MKLEVPLLKQTSSLNCGPTAEELKKIEGTDEDIIVYKN